MQALRDGGNRGCRAVGGRRPPPRQGAISRSRWAAWPPCRRPIVRRRPPNVIILETEGRNDILTGLDQLATVCDAGTRVIVIGRINDVTLYRRTQFAAASAITSSPDYGHRRRPEQVLQPVLGARGPSGRPHHCGGGRKGRRRRLHHRPQCRLGDRARSGAGFGGRRSRPRLRHRRPRLQPGSAAGHCGRGVLARPRRHGLHGPPAVEMHRPSEPVPRRRRWTRSTISAPTPSTRSSTRCARPCPASCSTSRINGRAGPSAL